jgi:cytochrome P450
VADRKAHPRDPARDLTTALLAARPDGAPLPEEMIVGTLRQLVVASMGAMSVVIGSQVVYLAKHPDLQRLLRRESARIPEAIEELLRLYPPYRGFARTAVRDVTIRGRLIRKDEPIAMLFPSANRDADIFERPDEFDIGRKPNKHLAFGRGAHKCVAAAMARLELRIVLEELLARTESFGLEGEVRMASWLEFGPSVVPLHIRGRRHEPA